MKKSGGSSSASSACGSPPCNRRRSRSARSSQFVHSSHRTGCRWTDRFRPVRESLNLCVTASVEEPVARTFNDGYSSATTLSSRLRSSMRCTSSNTNMVPGRRRSRNNSKSRSSRLLEGRSQFMSAASGSMRASVVLPTRRTPESQTIGRSAQARLSRSSHRSRLTGVVLAKKTATWKIWFPK